MVRSWFRGARWGLFVALTVWVVACSSQHASDASSDPDGAGSIDAGTSGDGAGAADVPACSNCGVTVHTLVQQAAPDQCTFSIGQVPPVPANVRVENGTAVVPQSTTEGWTYTNDMKGIVLAGSYCQAARAGTITTLTMLFGCPSCPIP